MTKQKEQQEINRIAKVIRAARKLYGYDQRTLAQKINVSQATLSRWENAQTQPATKEWFTLCSTFDLHAQNVYYSGIIDHCQPIIKGSHYPDHGFKLAPRYSRFLGSTVRTVYPFLKFMTYKLGEDKTEDYCLWKGIDPDFFVVFDNQINVRFSLDLISTMISQGILTQDEISHLAQPIQKAETHGRVSEKYHDIHEKKILLMALIQNIKCYETNCQYDVIDEGHKHLTVAVKPSHTLKDAIKKESTVLGDVMCQYKKHYIKWFSTFFGENPVEIHEKECNFQGHSRCVYEIQVSP